MTEPREMDDGELETPSAMGDALRAVLKDDFVVITQAGQKSMQEAGVDPNLAIEAVTHAAGRNVPIFIRKA